MEMHIQFLDSIGYCPVSAQAYFEATKYGRLVGHDVQYSYNVPLPK